MSRPNPRKGPDFRQFNTPGARFQPLNEVEEGPWPIWPTVRRYSLPEIENWFVLVFIREMPGERFEAVGVFQRMTNTHPPKPTGQEAKALCSSMGEAQVRCTEFRGMFLDALKQAAYTVGIRQFHLQVEEVPMVQHPVSEPEPPQSSLILPGDDRFKL